MIIDDSMLYNYNFPGFPQPCPLSSRLGLPVYEHLWTLQIFPSHLVVPEASGSCQQQNVRVGKNDLQNGSRDLADISWLSTQSDLIWCNMVQVKSPAVFQEMGGSYFDVYAISQLRAARINSWNKMHKMCANWHKWSEPPIFNPHIQ